MFSQASSGLKKSIVVVVMIAMLTFSAPKKSEAILLILLAPLGVSAVGLIITELIIYCATGLICGSGGGSGGGGGTTATVGDSCFAENYCGQSSTGTVQSDGFCDATPPPNEECTNFPLDDDSLTINPTLVKVGDDVTVSYDLGPDNFPGNCTLTGPQIGTLTPTTQTDTITVTTTGPNVFKLECGTEIVEKKIAVVGTVQEI